MKLCTNVTQTLYSFHCLRKKIVTLESSLSVTFRHKKLVMIKTTDARHTSNIILLTEFQC